MPTSTSPPAKSRVTRSTLHPGLHRYPAFYACYLLRSYQNGKHNPRTYVGSTPDPPRRIRQHNGQIKGGATRTKYYRPWEMELICYGFPSKLVALQFEWALNTPYKSRHLQITTQPQPKPDKSSKLNREGKVVQEEKENLVVPTKSIKKPMFPRSMGNRVEVKLKVLRQMLTCLPWSQYPLRVIFFEEGVYRLWLEQGNPSSSKNKQQKISQEKDYSSYPIQAILRPEGVDGMRKVRRGLSTSSEQDHTKPIEVHDQEAILEDYEKIEAIKQRCKGNLKCDICFRPIDMDAHLLYAICQSSACLMSTHLLCLSKHFLNSTKVPAQSSEEESSRDEPLPRVLPDRGSCPTCSVDLRWGDLIQSCYRRMPKNPTQANISETDNENDDDEEEDEIDLDIINSMSDEDLVDTHKNPRQHHRVPPPNNPKKKKPSVKELTTTGVQSTSKQQQPKKPNPKREKIVRNKKTTTLHPDEQEEEDEPEQDFVKMMHELHVSSDSD